jgi:hypothetical protein
VVTAAAAFFFLTPPPPRPIPMPIVAVDDALYFGLATATFERVDDVC